MNNDIVPRKRADTREPIEPQSPLVYSPESLPPVETTPSDASGGVDLDPQAPKESSRPLKKKLLSMLLVVSVVIIGALGAATTWYNRQLEPVSPNAETERVRVTIESGATPDAIAAQLADEQLIRSERAFSIYTRLEGVRNLLQAGTFSLSPSESTPEIIDQLTASSADEISVTFFPGGTLTDSSDTPMEQKTDHKTALLRVGYGEEEIDAAFARQYDHPVFAGKPASADLEGYIYGETYNFATASTVDDILTRTFDELYAQIEEADLEAKFKAQGLTLFEGITLASIIQREVSNPDDQKQVAQVFYTRLADGMQLGADATFIYGAKKLGVAPTVGLDSPYNTREVKGLPPGPISSPGLTALEAVANPAEGDFVYFVSGDDGTNYFSRTLEEHEAKTRQYCRANCSLF